MWSGEQRLHKNFEIVGFMVPRFRDVTREIIARILRTGVCSFFDWHYGLRLSSVSGASRFLFKSLWTIVTYWI